MDPQTSAPHVLHVFLHIRGLELLGIEAFATVTDGHAELLLVEQNINLNRLLVVVSIGVLDDIGAGFIHCQLDLANVFVTKSNLPGDSGYEFANDLEVVGLAGNSEMIPFFLLLVFHGVVHF